MHTFSPGPAHITVFGLRNSDTVIKERLGILYQDIEPSQPSFGGLKSPESKESVGETSDEIKKLDLHKRRLHKFAIPKHIDPSKLCSLNMDSNKITSIKEEHVQPLDSLTKLEISCNRITELPENFGILLNHLTDLHIHDNRLAELPNSIGNLKLLRVLDVHNNCLTKFPDAVCNLQSLRWLLAGGNRIGTLPLDIGSLINLEMLSLRGNNLSYLPSSFGRLVNLTRLYINNNEDELASSFDPELIISCGYSQESTQEIVRCCRTGGR